MNSSSKRLRVLVVEDEGMVVMLIEDMLADLGHEVGAIASRLQDGVEMARTGTFDLAIVDLNLGGQPGYPIAAILRERGIPFVFATGYGEIGLEPQYAGTPTLAKPFVCADLQKMVSQALSETKRQL